MILLHAIWSLAAGEDGGPTFFLWGEDLDRTSDRPVPGVRTECQPLPFLASPREVRSHLRKVADGILYECAEPADVDLLWPSRHGVPLPSRFPRRRVLAHPHFQPWKVRGLSVPPADALCFLTGLPREAPAPVLYGGSLRFWVEAGSFCLGLIARQRFLPTVFTDGSNGSRRHVAEWRPVLTDEMDRSAAELLVRAMPGVCRSEVPSAAARRRGRAALLIGRVLGRAISQADPELLLRDFLESVLDATLRRLLAEEGFPETARRGGPTRIFGGPLGAWLRALGWIDGEVGGEPQLLDEFARDVRQWNDALSEPAPGAYRTAFRLLPPSEEGEPESWTLEFHLQDRTDPDLLIPAARVWETPGTELAWGGRVFERPQDQLLEDLGRASRVFPPLERALETALPARTSLNLEEAYSFLSQAAPLLRESGFGILLPSWWEEETARPRLRLRLSPDGSGREVEEDFDAGSGRSAGGGSDAEPGGAGGTQAESMTAGAWEHSIESVAVQPIADPEGPDSAWPIPTALGATALIQYEWQVALGSEILTADEFRRLTALKQPLVRVRGRWFEFHPEKTASIEEILSVRAERRTLTLAEAVRWGTGGLDPRFDLPPPEVHADGWVGRLMESVRGTDAPAPIRMGEGFVGVLRPYQERGVGWLEFMRQCGLGACLADDMGLGKTVQLIALLLHERSLGRPERGPIRPTLVLCPMSVVGNWQREIERFAPSLRVLVHHGLRRLRDHAFLPEVSANDVVITTYALAHRDRALLRRVEWERLVLDEAQNIKNPSTLQARAVRSFRALTRVALTGTPLENRLAELWSILDTLNPGYLGTRAEFRRTFGVPIERYRDPRRRTTLRRLVQPFLLRRLKVDPDVIRDLPEKLEMRVFCNLTREQATIYQAVVSDMLGAIEGSSGIARRGLILAALTRLKQVCNHPAHYLQDGSAVEGRSGKVARLFEMLEEILAVGDRALVFTQFTEMGWMLQSHLADRLRTEVLFLHGGTPKGARDRMVDRFQDKNGPPIFILSLRAGGTGLNLTAATHVFHFDRWWNPAVEDQATDRAFRIGQTRNVQVHKLVCVGTLEEKIDAMIMEKRELASSIVGAGEQWLTELDTAQLREVLSLSRDAVSEG